MIFVFNLNKKTQYSVRDDKRKTKPGRTTRHIRRTDVTSYDRLTGKRRMLHANSYRKQDLNCGTYSRDCPDRLL